MDAGTGKAAPIRWRPGSGKDLVGGTRTSLLVAVEAGHGGPVDAGRGIRWRRPTQQPRSGGGRKRESTWLVETNTSLLVAVEADHGGPVDAGHGIRWWEPTQRPRTSELDGLIVF